MGRPNKKNATLYKALHKSQTGSHAKRFDKKGSINADTPIRETVFSKMAIRDINSSCLALWWRTKSETRLKSSSRVCRDVEEGHIGNVAHDFEAFEAMEMRETFASQQANTFKTTYDEHKTAKQQNSDCSMGGPNLSNIQRLSKVF